MLHDLYLYAIYTIIALAIMTLGATLFNQGGYGKLMGDNIQLKMPDRLAWIIFESPQWFAFALTYWLLVPGPYFLPGLVLFVIWQAHYSYRGFIYPWRRRGSSRGFPVVAVLMGFTFNALNGFTNAWAVAHAPHLADPAWLASPWFIGGALLAVCGWLINFQADNILLHLRDDGSDGYRIPYGGAFRYVSSAHYFGEIIWWTGWALMASTLAGWAFLLFVLCNLVPRAVHNHRWYQQQFADYPKERKAIIPFVL